MSDTAHTEREMFKFYRPRTEVQPSPFVVVPGKPSVLSALRLGRKTNSASILRDNRISNFNCAIATQADSDRTGAIAGRRI